jgi:hypothetical protein
LQQNQNFKETAWGLDDDFRQRSLGTEKFASPGDLNNLLQRLQLHLLLDVELR